MHPRLSFDRAFGAYECILEATYRDLLRNLGVPTLMRPASRSVGTS